jgi:hypothetical protein
MGELNSSSRSSPSRYLQGHSRERTLRVEEGCCRIMQTCAFEAVTVVFGACWGRAARRCSKHAASASAVSCAVLHA